MKIVKNFLFNVSYQVFILLVPLVTTPYISRVLGSEGVGINAYTNSIIQYFILFGSIGISTYGNRQIAYSRGNARDVSQDFWEISILRFLTIAISYIAFLIYLNFVSQYHGFFFAQSFQIIAAAFDISWLFMGLENFKITVLRNFVVKIISLVCIFTMVKTENDLGTYILILSLSLLVGNLSLWGYLKRYISKPDFKNLKIFKHIKPSISLFIPQVAIQIYLVLNKTMLGSISGVKSAGYFEYSDRIVKIVLAVVTSIGTVMLPRMASIYASRDFGKLKQYMYTTGDFINFLSIPLMFGLAAIAPKFSVWFMGEEFAITGNLMIVESAVIFLIGWGVMLGNQYLIPTNQTGKYTWAVSISALVNLVLNVPLIYSIGVMGATIATVASEITSTGLQLFFIRRQIEIPKLFKGLWKYLLSGLIMFLIVRYLNNIFTMTIVTLATEVVAGALIYVILCLVLRAPFITVVKDFITESRSKKRED
ncbi:polysaccharide biosynthesis C-terminal domain-containing protein [Pediococcus acidilactici]|uniref:oligosaccharide flippase family protein n=3 Tax=Pediococcus acidilactici TaxID=1254 RepID=UPI000326DCE4|nr:polysaccharide biosynthesis C-terminal domain-containing protein [Pediococcus acidilactici]EOA08791.1 integral membrane protein MviN, mviN [Pediococcus acidilactici D3]MBW4798142.1 polysaccharide biosynthesis C-terminal domain-containing protein [Pediococcus acidilactici]MBW9307333.1 flippase [Pediococcus acidilactici]MCE5962859.1 polysaccharide biosynthesis C-terminal domain-containing protein [Pediococcus acidilactici]MCW8083747.1 polysaccharide biosynthesis C-terminal domain-containing p